MTLTQQLLEREGEIARLRAAVESAAGGAGTVVMVEGAPGIGKSSLLDEVARLASEEGASVLRASGGELERALGFGVARDLLARRVRDTPQPDRTRLLSGAASVALPALGLAEVREPPAEEAAVHHGLTWLVTDLAEERPLILIVDDVQWADAASAGWLIHLARRVGDLPVALLLGARPPAGEPEPLGLVALRELTGMDRVRPAPLELNSVAALVRSFYAPDADDAFVAACHGAAGGNPFHTHALLDAAASHDVPPTAAGAPLLAELAPEAIQHSVAAGLRRSGPDATALAKACAVLGDVAELRHAASLADLEPAVADIAADRLADQNLLSATRPLRFAHPVLLAAVRQGMPAGERAGLHRRAAALFEDEQDARRAAAHLLEVEPSGDARVTATLVSAADDAMLEGAAVHAVRLLDRALAEPPPTEERPLVLGRLGRARVFANAKDPIDPLLEAADAVRSADARAHLLATAAWASVWADSRGLDAIAQRVAALPPSSCDGRMRADSAVASTLMWIGRPPQPSVAELVARAERLSGDSPSERELLGAAGFAAAVHGTLSADQLRPIVQRALRDPAETPIPAALMAGMAATFAGMNDEAMGPMDDAITRARRGGNRGGAAGVVGVRSVPRYLLGELREAEMDVRTIWAAAREHPANAGIWSLALFQLAFLLAARGHVQEGRELMEDSRPFDRCLEIHRSLLDYASGVLSLEAGEAAAAVEPLVGFERSLERLDFHHSPWAVSHRAAAVEALVQVGDTEAARSLAERDVRLARVCGAPGLLGYALRTMGMAVGGSEGRALLEEAATLLEQAGHPERLARTLLELGRSLRLDGQLTEAREPLRRALGLAEACGAELVAQRAFDELRAAGAKPRRRELGGPGSLTPSEERVARLAAAGRTNREIAQSLFVSSKTVETHLGHIYAKLQIAGRSELAAALAPTRNAS